MLAVCVACGVGCGGAPRDGRAASAPSSNPVPKATTSKAKPNETSEKTKSAEQPSLPTNCTDVRGICMPPSEFVDRLCRRNYPDVAVYMMGPTQPWTHRFVRVKVAQAVNPISGRVGEVPLTFGEEIIVLRYKSGTPQSAIQVSGTERYEVLRWDGSCASLEEGEFVEKVPTPQLRYVASTWLRIGDKYRAALLANSAIAAAEETRKTDCKGLGLGRPPKCHKAMEDLNRIVAEAVHAGLELPLPDPMP